MLFICLAMALFASPLQAQSLTPLSELMDGKKGSPYPFVRCSAFYQAYDAWVGTDQLNRVDPGILINPDQTTASLGQSISTLMRIAEQLRSTNNSESEDQARETAVRDKKIIENLYLSHIATIGVLERAVDPLLLSDLGLCKLITELAVGSFTSTGR